MYPWYRDSVGQFCSPNSMPTTIKTENGYNDCMLALDYAAQSKPDHRSVRPTLFGISPIELVVVVRGGRQPVTSSVGT
ncbi:hypothetical protein GE061_016040 [Apolygus lucorum]|uniref:Uncharacterized protein n=1 Tax=Apolygus lucorum TaxID=248454 RepID=A0A8S9XF41_APOLU|nr:hypothetical protein GE061_016040 [Apolygus lucorum]